MAPHISESEPDFLLHLTTHRYLPGRLPTANPNPRGKHHRNPLPWRRNKLASAQCWDGDANLWYQHLWDLQKTSPGTPPPEPNKPHFLTYIEAGARRHKSFYSRCECCWEYMMSRTWEDRKREWAARRKEGMEMHKAGVEMPGERIAMVECEDEEVEEWRGGNVRMGDVIRERDVLWEEPGYVVRWKVEKRTRRRGRGVERGVSTPVGTDREERSTPDSRSEGVWEGEGTISDDGDRGWVAVSEGGSDSDYEFDDWERCR
ncbi:hypothetical protein B0T14DRAFT_570534 [Immersiella caudata]|uniref:Uncharacterized protein n=1 Tax=Immersiella caudata TaxID=314043 RepID=A0AA40BV19_9PEZI|nr:hypothetical protein B0T14DRAFT_570534 [Immersiella caudata]